MGVDLHVAEFAAAGIILPPKDDLSVLQAEQTMVGDRYPMGVAGQIMQHMLWSAEGRLGIHHPILAKQRAQECCKGLFRGECFLPTRESSEPRVPWEVRGRTETCLPSRATRVPRVPRSTRLERGLCSIPAHAVSPGLGGVCQAALRRTTA